MTKLDRAIEELCLSKGLTFAPWQFPGPWEVGDNEVCPYPANTVAASWWPKCLALRAKLKAELKR
jgi:hypothetical protein